MNENILSFIKWAAGIVITLAIISIVIIIFTTSRGAVSEGVGRLSEFQTSISESELTQYDMVEVSGAEVVYLLKDVKDDYLAVQVETGNGSTTWYGYSCTLGDPATMGSAASGSIIDANDETNAAFINKSGKFLGAIYRDANEVIVAVTFTQQ